MTAAIACSSGRKGETTDPDPETSRFRAKNSVEDTSDSIATLPLPVLPDNITDPEEKAAFVSRHFWDSLNFSDTALTLDSAFMEQNFANFLTVLAVTPEAPAQEAVDSLISRSVAHPETFDLLWWVVTHYLDDPNSPMRNEELFTLFLNNVSNNRRIPEATHQRAGFRLKQALKNRRGTIASDFRFINHKGDDSSLSKTVGKARQTILMFYDPDCEVCADVEKRLAGNERINDGIRNGDVQIVAIDPFGTDIDKWRKHAASLPSSWIVGRSPDGEIDNNEIYDIRATPTIYILDSSGTVIAKDASF